MSDTPASGEISPGPAPSNDSSSDAFGATGGGELVSGPAPAATPPDDADRPTEHGSRFWAYVSLAGLCVAVVVVWRLTLPEVDYDQAFITTWETTKANQEIFIPTAPGTEYDFTIDWGDGTVEESTGTDPDPVHMYQEAGTYEVAISGHFPRLFLNAGGSNPESDPENARKLQTIEQWGAIEWTSMEGAFAGATDMRSNAPGVPNLSKVTNMRRMLNGSGLSKSGYDALLLGWSELDVPSGLTLGAGGVRYSPAAQDARRSLVDEAGWTIRAGQHFRLADNGVTVVCTDSDVGAVGTVNGVTYTKRTRGQITTDNAATTCTSGITDMRWMFRGAESFDPDHAPKGAPLP